MLCTPSARLAQLSFVSLSHKSLYCVKLANSAIRPQEVCFASVFLFVFVAWSRCEFGSPASLSRSQNGKWLICPRITSNARRSLQSSMAHRNSEFLHADDALETLEQLTDKAIVTEVLAADSDDNDDSVNGNDDMVGQAAPVFSQETLQMIQSLQCFIFVRDPDALEKNVSKLHIKQAKLTDMATRKAISVRNFLSNKMFLFLSLMLFFLTF